MSIKVGSAWLKSSENGKMFLSTSFDEAALPLTISEDKFLILWEIPEEQRTREQSPHYSMHLAKSTPQ